MLITTATLKKANPDESLPLPSPFELAEAMRKAALKNPRLIEERLVGSQDIHNYHEFNEGFEDYSRYENQDSGKDRSRVPYARLR